VTSWPWCGTRSGTRLGRHRRHGKQAQPLPEPSATDFSRDRRITAACAASHHIAGRGQDRPHRRNDARRDRRNANGRTPPRQTQPTPPAPNAPRNTSRMTDPRQFFHRGEGPAAQCSETRRAATREPGLARAGGEHATVKRQGAFPLSDQRERTSTGLAALGEQRREVTHCVAQPRQLGIAAVTWIVRRLTRDSDLKEWRGKGLGCMLRNVAPIPRDFSGYPEPASHVVKRKIGEAYCDKGSAC
jgi:hypothetical protein